MNRRSHYGAAARLALLVLLCVSFTPVEALEGAHGGLSPHGERALALSSQAWVQHETEHFVIHYAQSFIGKPVGVEAEYYYRVITAELEIRPPAGESRAHIFVFENREGWQAFSRGAELEEWTGAVAIGSELFVPRYPEFRTKGHALGHEVAHLVVNRAFGRTLPLWLSEGYAEEVSVRAYAAFMRQRGYRAKPRVAAVARPFPMEELLAATHYPAADRVSDFYRQSRQLVGFLYHHGGREKFARFLRLMAQGSEGREGSKLEAALGSVYPEWPTAKALERAFGEKIIIGVEPEESPRPERDE